MARKLKEARHVRLYHWILASPAWKSLNAVERSLYVEIASRYAGPGTNGKIVLSVRQAADALHVSKATASRAFDGLQRRGLLPFRSSEDSTSRTGKSKRPSGG